MSTSETTAAPTAPILRTALVAGAGGCQLELARALRDVAREAARQWGWEQVSSEQAKDPAEFGQSVATVYLAALRELEAGFAPAPTKEW